MSSIDFNLITKVYSNINKTSSGVDFSGKLLSLDTEKDAQPIVDAINKCSDLQCLSLTGNSVRVAAAQAIAKAFKHHPELKIAKFSRIFFASTETQIAPALCALSQGFILGGLLLHSLDLSDNNLGSVGVLHITKLLKSETCSQLQDLRLNNNNLGTEGGKILAKALSSSKCRLKVFAANWNKLDDEAAVELAAAFENMGTLEEVDLYQNSIYEEGITQLLEAFKRNPNLGLLNLSYNAIGPKGAAAIANALPSLKNLKIIDFAYCLIKNKGAKALAKAFKDNSHSVEVVYLSHNEIGREACMDVVDSLATSETLKKLVLIGNSLGGDIKKKTIRDKLGESAILSDSESELEYESESEISNEKVSSDEDLSSEEEEDKKDETQLNKFTEIVKNDKSDSLGLEIEEKKKELKVCEESPKLLETTENCKKINCESPTEKNCTTGSFKTDPVKIKAANQAFGMFVAQEMENLPLMKRHSVMCEILKLFENNITL